MSRGSNSDIVCYCSVWWIMPKGSIDSCCPWSDSGSRRYGYIAEALAYRMGALSSTAVFKQGSVALHAISSCAAQGTLMRCLLSHGTLGRCVVQALSSWPADAFILKAESAPAHKSIVKDATSKMNTGITLTSNKVHSQIKAALACQRKNRLLRWSDSIYAKQQETNPSWGWIADIK